MAEYKAEEILKIEVGSEYVTGAEPVRIKSELWHVLKTSGCSMWAASLDEDGEYMWDNQ